MTGFLRARTRRRLAGTLAVSALLGGLLGPGRGAHYLSQFHLDPTETHTATTTRPPAGGVTAGSLVVASGHGWTAGGLLGPVPSAGSCHLRHASSGEPLPDPRCSPGAIDPTVTQGDLASTLCSRGGYTTKVRPPEAITGPVKRRVMAAYGVPWSQASTTELDHLVPLEEGGASDVRNLWPEPDHVDQRLGRGPFLANDKDSFEDWVRQRGVCGSAHTSLAAAQRAFATDWTTVLAVLHLPPIPKGYQG